MKMAPTEKDDEDDALDDAEREDESDEEPAALDEPDRDDDAEPSDDEIVEGEVVDEDEAADALPVSVKPPPGRGGPLAKSDPLQAYMRDVQRYPLLSREDEHDLAVKYFEGGDVEAAARLVTA